MDFIFKCKAQDETTIIWLTGFGKSSLCITAPLLMFLLMIFPDLLTLSSFTALPQILCRKSMVLHTASSTIDTLMRNGRVQHLCFRRMLTGRGFSMRQWALEGCSLLVLLTPPLSHSESLRLSKISKKKKKIFIMMVMKIKEISSVCSSAINKAMCSANQ